MGLEEKLPDGVLLTIGREAGQLDAQVVAVAGDLRPGLLRDRDDGLRRAALRLGPLRHGGVPGLAAAGRPDDRRRPGQPEDGAGAAPDLRPDARAEVGARRWASARPRGGMFNNYAIVQGVDHVVPVDMYLPGCPPRPEMLIDAILKLHEKIMDEPLGPEAGASGSPTRRSSSSRRRYKYGAMTSMPAVQSSGREEQSGSSTGAERRRAVGPGDDRHGRRDRAGRTADSPYGIERHGHVRRRRQRRHLRLRRPGPRAVDAAARPQRPYGGYFDEVVDALDEAYPEFDDAIEKVVVDRGELTLHIAPRAHRSRSCQAHARRRRAALRAVLVGVRRRLPRHRRAPAARRSTT